MEFYSRVEFYPPFFLFIKSVSEKASPFLALLIIYCHVEICSLPINELLAESSGQLRPCLQVFFKTATVSGLRIEVNQNKKRRVD